MLRDHADKTARCEPRIHTAKFPSTDTSSDVVLESFVEAKRMGAEEAVGQFVVLERGVKVKAREAGIVDIPPQDFFRNSGERFARRGRVEHVAKLLVGETGVAFRFDNGPIQIFFMREMAEEDCLVDFCQVRDFTRGGTAKAFLRK